jgi:hypothetical protein
LDVGFCFVVCRDGKDDDDDDDDDVEGGFSAD